MKHVKTEAKRGLKLEFFSVALGLYCVNGLSRISVSGGCSSWRYTGFSLRWLVCCRAWSLELGLQQLWGPALGAPRHVESSQTRTLSPELALRFPSTVPSGKFVVLVMSFFFFSFLFSVISLCIFRVVSTLWQVAQRSPMFHRFL